MKRIKQWIRHNPVLKIGSLLLAFLTWLIVVNYSNPKVKGEVTIPFDVLNEKAVSNAGQVYSLNTSAVTVEYSVRSKLRNSIQPENFTAYIDMEDYSITGAVPIYLEIDSSISELITDVSIAPTVVHVTTEKIQQKRFTIKPNLIGTVADGFVAGELSLTPEYIYVKGPVSVMGQISGVCIDIDITGASSEVTGMSSVYFTDANGSELTGIEENLSFAGDISYSMPVYRIKTLTVNAFPGGAPASGYTVDSVETSPTFLSVYGPEDALDQYSYILIPGNVLNISGISENKTFNIDPTDYLPEELKPVSLTPEITVLVKVRNIHEQQPTSEAATAAATVSATTAFGPHTIETQAQTEETAPPETSPTGPSVVETHAPVFETTETVSSQEWTVPVEPSSQPVEETLPEATSEEEEEEDENEYEEEDTD